MTALIEIGLKASVLMAVAVAIVTVMYRASAATRHFIWTLTIVGLLLLPIVAMAIPRWEIAVPIRPSDVSTQMRAPLRVSGADVFRAVPTGSTPVAPIEGEWASSATNTPWFTLAAIATATAYGLGVLLLLGRVLVQRHSMKRIAREATAVADAEWLALLEVSAARIGFDRPVRLLRSREHLMPMTMGTVALSIVIPADADDWDEDRRRAVLLHELAHIARCDCLTQTLSAIACAVYWIHPGVWYVASRLRIEREVACDDRVLAAGAQASSYAGHLLELAYAWSGRRWPALVVGMAGSRKLEGRMRAILDSTRNRTAPTRRVWLAGAAGAAALLLTIAAVSMTVTTASADGRNTLAVWVDEPHEREEQAADGSDRFTGTWEIRPGRSTQRVRIVIEARGLSVKGEIDADAIDRVAPQALSTSNGPVRFNIAREAGTLQIEGTLKAGAGSGTFTFAPSETFIAGLETRGYVRPSAHQVFALAQHDIGLAFVDELATQKYARPEVSELARAANHGVDIDFVRDIAQAGYQVGTLEALIRFRDHGVDPDFIRALRGYGLTDLSPEDLVRARDHGVDGDFVGGLKDLGYAPLPLDSLVRARDHGVDPDYVRGMRQLGTTVTIEELIRTRDHGVDPEFVNEMRRLGYTLTIADLIRARDHGVARDYIEAMAAVGYRGLPIETLIRLLDHGVTPDYVQEAAKRGYKNLPADEIIRLRDQGVGSGRSVIRELHDSIANVLFKISNEVSEFLQEARREARKL